MVVDMDNPWSTNTNMGDYIYIYIFNMNDAQMDSSNQIAWLIGTLFHTHHLTTLFIREMEFIKKKNHT